MDSTPPPPLTPPARPAPPARGARVYPRMVLGAIAAAGIVLLLQSLWGEASQLSWSLFGAGAAVGLVGVGGWQLLRRGLRRDEPGRIEIGFSAWLGFSTCLFALLGMIPLLILAVSADARRWMDPKDRIAAALTRDGATLEIRFPFPTDGGAVNLTVDATPIPGAWFAENPGSHRWEDGNWRAGANGGPRRLLIDYALLRVRFDLPPRPQRLGINADPASPQTADSSHRRIQQQWMEIGD